MFAHSFVLGFNTPRIDETKTHGGAVFSTKARTGRLTRFGKNPGHWIHLLKWTLLSLIALNKHVKEINGVVSFRGGIGAGRNFWSWVSLWSLDAAVGQATSSAASSPSGNHHENTEWTCKTSQDGRGILSHRIPMCQTTSAPVLRETLTNSQF